MPAKRQYEVVYDRFHRRWALKPQGLPGAIQVAKTREALIERAVPICSMQDCLLKIYSENGQLEEERNYGGG